MSAKNLKNQVIILKLYSKKPRESVEMFKVDFSEVSFSTFNTVKDVIDYIGNNR